MGLLQSEIWGAARASRFWTVVEGASERSSPVPSSEGAPPPFLFIFFIPFPRFYEMHILTEFQEIMLPIDAIFPSKTIWKRRKRRWHGSRSSAPSIASDTRAPYRDRGWSYANSSIAIC
jgi:hypothetical protein